MSSDRVGDDVFELTELISATRETGVAVLAFGVDFHFTAKVLSEAVKLLDRRGSKGERVAFEFFQHVLSSNM